MRNVSLFVVPLLMLTALSGCQRDANSTKEKFIEDMLVAFGKQKSDLLKQSKGVFEDIRVYRDGKKDIVVFERKLSEGKTLEDPELKSHLIQEIKESEASSKALKLGIRIRMIDRDSDEQVVSDVMVSAEDL